MIYRDGPFDLANLAVLLNKTSSAQPLASYTPQGYLCALELLQRGPEIERAVA